MCRSCYIKQVHFRRDYKKYLFDILRVDLLKGKIIFSEKRNGPTGYSPNHPYLIISGEYIERNGEILFKRDFSKIKGC